MISVCSDSGMTNFEIDDQAFGECDFDACLGFKTSGPGIDECWDSDSCDFGVCWSFMIYCPIIDECLNFVISDRAIFERLGLV